MRKQWVVKKITPYAVDLSKSYNISPIVIQLLLNRGIKKEDFFSFLSSSTSRLYSPFLLPDMEKAIKRIREAIKRKEKIFLFGDYDVDGITSLIIFYEYIKDFATDVGFYIPHRIEEGYGLNEMAIRRIKGEGASLLICFDCGTNSLEEVQLAQSLGIDVIVLDHHTPKKNLNVSYAFVNPKREDAIYPFKDLSSAGVTFKLVQALKDSVCLHFLDLVAMSIVCDVVPLKNENRILLNEGIKWLRNSQRLGISTLCEVARVKPANIEPYHIGYILGPRINACGRISSAQEAVELFISSNLNTVKAIAAKLDAYNRTRRSIEQIIFREAEEMIEKKFRDDYAFIVHKEGWHPGVLGIVASKLVDKYWRPTFVIGMDGKRGRGSARSIPGLHIIEVLDECRDFLATYGGHKKAAGIEIFEDNIGRFKEKFNTLTRQRLDNKDFVPTLEIDLEIGFEDINLELVDQIEKLKPFGEENPAPLFITRKVFPKTSPKKVNGNLYTFWVSDNTYTYEAIFYSKDNFLDIVNYDKNLDIVYLLEKNSYYNNLRLVIKDLRLS